MRDILRLRRLLLVTLLTGLALVSVQVLSTGTTDSRAAGPLLLPDLITLPPSDIDIVEVESGKGRNRSVEKRLLLSNGIANVGVGPLEMYPVSEDCDGDGNVRNDRLVIQRIFEDTNGGGFQRGSDAVAEERDVACSIFHAKHHHWHLENFSRYDLVDSAHQVVATAEKISFCVIDTDRQPGTTAGAFYTGCGRNATLGISPGWGDVYGYWLDGQWIVITNVPDGTYCLWSTADPGNGIAEANETNNGAGVSVMIDGANVTEGSSCSP